MAWRNRPTSITKAPGSSIARTLTLDPKDHQQKLTDAAQAAGADYRFETEGTRLVVDGGKVMGVVGKSGSKEIRFRANKAVILATGGFTSCPDLLEKCMKGLSGIKSMACPAHTGLMHYARAQSGSPIRRHTVDICELRACIPLPAT